MVKQRSQVDDVLVQFTHRFYGDRLAQAAEVLATFAMQLRGFDRLTIGLDDAPDDFGLTGVGLVPIWDEDSIFDDRDGWRIAADTELRYLAQFITPQFTEAVKRKIAWF